MEMKKENMHLLSDTFFPLCSSWLKKANIFFLISRIYQIFNFYKQKGFFKGLLDK